MLRDSKFRQQPSRGRAKETPPLSSSDHGSSRTPALIRTQTSDAISSMVKVAPHKRSKSHFRQHSIQSLHLDLDGLDLGGDFESGNTPSIDTNQVAFDWQKTATETTSASSRQRSHSQSRVKSKPLEFRMTTSYSVGGPRESLQDRCCQIGPCHTFSLDQDTFAAHLRSECKMFHDIIPTDAVLQAVETTDKAITDASASNISPRVKENLVTPEQVLGGFASLGLSSSDQDGIELSKSLTVQDSVESSYRDPLDHGGPLVSAPTSDSHSGDSTWQSLSSRPSNPLETLDIMSIDEMGLHSVDVGNVSDWEGCKLSAEINGPDLPSHSQKLEWSIARSTKRQKKWIVVPNRSFSSNPSAKLDEQDQAQRTIIVSERSLWLEPDHHDDQIAPSPFSGHAGYELKVLRTIPDSFFSTIYLANPESHRILHAYRAGNSTPLTTADGCVVDSPRISLVADTVQPAYPVLRRSRSKPYLRREPLPLRRSRSKPYLRYSIKQQQQQQQHPSIEADDFAPSLPGAPGAQYHPDEAWPSARRPPSPSITSTWSSASSGTASSSEAETNLSSISPLAATLSQDSTCGRSEPVSSPAREVPQPPPLPPMTNLFSKVFTMAQTSTLSDRSKSKSSQSSADLALDFLSRESNKSRDDLSHQKWSSDQSRGPSPRSSVIQLRTQQRSMRRGSSQSHRAEEWYQKLPAPAQECERSSSAFARTTNPVSKTNVPLAKSSSSTAAFKPDSSPVKASHRKDRRLSGWFKRKVAVAPSLPQFAGSPNLNPLVYSPPSFLTPSHVTADSQTPPFPSSSFSMSNSFALTKTALEQVDAAVNHDESPESTIIGSRRGSEGIPINPLEHSLRSNSGMAFTNSEQAPSESRGALPCDSMAMASSKRMSPSMKRRMTMEESRVAVAASLAKIYGWSDEHTASTPTPKRDSAESISPSLESKSNKERGLSVYDEVRHSSPQLFDSIDSEKMPPSSYFLDLDEENALLGMENVPPEALTMLIPLPFLGRSRQQETLRYLRVSFVPFRPPTTSSPTESDLFSPLALRPGRPPSLSDSSSTSPVSVTAPASAPQPPSWIRKFGFTGGNSKSANASISSSVVSGAARGSKEMEPNPSRHIMWPSRDRSKMGFETFRVSALVLDAPRTSSEMDRPTKIDPRIPPAGTFPVVLGYCDGRNGLEMVPEGWAAVGLKSSPDASPEALSHSAPDSLSLPAAQSTRSPLAGMTDVIIAACAAIMEL